MTQHGRSTTRHGIAFSGIAVATVIALTGCGAPGGTGEQAERTPVSIEIGPDPVTITMRANQDQEALWSALVEGFESAYPSVTVDLALEDFSTLQQNGPRYISASEVPDLIRYPTPGEAVRDGLLLDLDPYAEAYGWDEFPASQLSQWRVSPDGLERGTGALYGMGAGFALVGMYVNLTQLEELGLEIPSTIDELAEALAVAKDAGATAIMGAGSNAYLIQGLMQQLGAADDVAAWVNNAPGADIDVPEAVEAAALVQEWVNSGYFPDDLVALDDMTALGRFQAGEGLFLYQGSWNAASMDATLPGEVGFFLLPPTEEGGRLYATSAPNGFVIPTKASHPNEAAAFLDWVNSDEGRSILVSVAGLAPGGRAEQPIPAVDENTVLAETLRAFQAVSEDDGLIDFLANATAGMLTATLIPQTQLLVSGQVGPEEFVAKLQSDYESDLGR